MISQDNAGPLLRGRRWPFIVMSGLVIIVIGGGSPLLRTVLLPFLLRLEGLLQQLRVVQHL